MWNPRTITADGFEWRTRDEIHESLAIRAANIQLDIRARGAVIPEHDYMIDELRSDEFLLADRDWSCSQEVELFERQRAIRFAAESAWIEANGDRIALLIEEHTQG